MRDRGLLDFRLGRVDQRIPPHHVGHGLVQPCIACFYGGAARGAEGAERVTDFLEKAPGGALGFKLPFAVQFEIPAVLNMLEHLLAGFDTHDAFPRRIKLSGNS